jgi:hypothetical protein
MAWDGIEPPTRGFSERVAQADHTGPSAAIEAIQALSLRGTDLIAPNVPSRGRWFGQGQGKVERKVTKCQELQSREVGRLLPSGQCLAAFVSFDVSEQCSATLPVQPRGCLAR